MLKHTAGPWEWNDKDQLIAVSVKAPIEPWEEEEDRLQAVIIETDSGFYPPRGSDRKLLAAAPDLLAALQRAVDEAVADDLDDWYANAKAVILKATGGAQ